MMTIDNFFIALTDSNFIYHKTEIFTCKATSMFQLLLYINEEFKELRFEHYVYISKVLYKRINTALIIMKLTI